jgi:integrase
MRGSVFKKGKVWYGHFDGPRKPDGSRNWQGLGRGFSTKKAAQDALSDALSKLARGQWVPPNKTTLADFLTNQWLPHKEIGIRKRTVERYAELIRHHIIPAIGSTKLSDLRPLHVQYLLDHVTRKDGKGNLSSRTKLHIYRVVSAALRQAVAWQLIQTNPAAAIKAPKPDRIQV